MATPIDQCTLWLFMYNNILLLLTLSCALVVTPTTDGTVITVTQLSKTVVNSLTLNRGEVFQYMGKGKLNASKAE